MKMLPNTSDFLTVTNLSFDLSNIAIELVFQQIKFCQFQLIVFKDLEETPGKVNESPFEHGWFMKLRLNAEGKSSFSKLLDEAAYKKHVEDSAH